MRIRTSTLAGLFAACLWPAAHAAAEGVTLAKIKALVGEYRQKSSGPFAGFAGVYDVLKSCRPLDHPDSLIGATWLMAKWVVWFEGDDILFAGFLAPANVGRGTLKFRQDYAASRSRTVKLYDVTWKGGDTDIVAFLADRELFGGKFEGGKYTSNYALRCGNEDQLIGSSGEVLRLMGQ